MAVDAQPAHASKFNLPAWQRIDSTIVFDHPRIRLAEDTVESPAGERTKWLYYPGAQAFVTVIAINDAHQILVSYQYNYPPNKVVDEFPGGGIEHGESPEDAGQRELLEETGWFAHTVQKIGHFRVDNRRTDKICHVLLATKLELRAAAPEAFEAIAFEWLDPPMLRDAIANGAIENGNLLAAWAIFTAIDGEYV